MAPATHSIGAHGAGAVVPAGSSRVAACEQNAPGIRDMDTFTAWDPETPSFGPIQMKGEPGTCGFIHFYQSGAIDMEIFVPGTADDTVSDWSHFYGIRACDTAAVAKCLGVDAEKLHLSLPWMELNIQDLIEHAKKACPHIPFVVRKKQT